MRRNKWLRPVCLVPYIEQFMISVECSMQYNEVSEVTHFSHCLTWVSSLHALRAYPSIFIEGGCPRFPFCLFNK